MSAPVRYQLGLNALDGERASFGLEFGPATMSIERMAWERLGRPGYIEVALEPWTQEGRS